MWDLPRPGLEPVSPALAGGFSTTAPPGKPPAYAIVLGRSDLFLVTSEYVVKPGSQLRSILEEGLRGACGLSPGVSRVGRPHGGQHLEGQGEFQREREEQGPPPPPAVLF